MQHNLVCNKTANLTHFDLILNQFIQKMCSRETNIKTTATPVTASQLIFHTFYNSQHILRLRVSLHKFIPSASASGHW